MMTLTAPDTRLYWLSFCDTDLPAGQQFLGCCLVEVDETDAAAAMAMLAERHPQHGPGADWIAAAIRQAHQQGCNPGGEVLSARVTLEDVVATPGLMELPRHQLLHRNELEARGLT